MVLVFGWLHIVRLGFRSIFSNLPQGTYMSKDGASGSFNSLRTSLSSTTGRSPIIIGAGDEL